MLRISEVGNRNGHLVLKLEGRIIGPWVDELRSACEKLLEREHPIALDLAEVSYADRDGVALLRELKTRQVRLHACSPFLGEELKAG